MNTYLQDNFNDGSIEIIQDKLYWISSDTPPVSEIDAFYFSTDTINFKKFLIILIKITDEI